jgi:hypothetical protein
MSYSDRSARLIIAFALSWTAVHAPPACADDCNDNGIADAIDIAEGASEDCNGNGVPDECDVRAALAFEANEVLISWWFNGVVAEDLDGDGDTDLAGTDTTGIIVLRNASDGRFVYSGSWSSGTNAGYPCAADIDLDGDIDLFTCNTGSNTVSFFRNSINQTFLAKQSFVCGPGPRWLHAVDVNIDGRPDMVVVLQSGELGVLLGDPVKVLLPVVTRPLEGSDICIAIADLDADNDPDIAVLYEDLNKVSVLLNDGSGEFENGPSYPTVEQPQRVLAADLDGDTRPELVIVDGLTSQVSVFQNAGEGNFTFVGSFDAGDRLNAPTLTAADVDGDGLSDILGGGQSTETWIVLRSLGEGALGAPEHYPGDGSPTVMAAFDADGDGDRDVVYSDASVKRTTLHRNSGSGSFPTFETAEVNKHPDGVATSDFDLDGDLDFVTFGYNGFSYTENLGAEAFAAPVVKLLDGETLGGAVGDTDGDGDLDVVLCTVTGSARLLHFRNNGQADFSKNAQTDLPNGGQLIGCPDMDQDGLADAVLVKSGNVRVFRGDGAGGFSLLQELADDAGWDGVCADLNGDGRPDLGLAYGTGAVCLSDGAQLNPGVALEGPSSLNHITAGDFDGDGDIDLAATNNSAAAVYLNQGDGGFDPAIMVEAGENPEEIAAADLDNDGLSDLLVGRGVQPHFVMLRARGGGEFDSPTAYDREANAIGMGDLNGDGWVDLVMAARTYPQDIVGLASVVWNRSAAAESLDQDGDGRPDECSCYPDFTRDGTLDLFDFLGYVNAFNAGDDLADCDGNGSLDLFDFLCFVNAFNEGC